ncbi:hypothetical protein QR685DRAFT_572615 [Neurospora intermedia]|uniref:Uncharacterized protein n=1 Tax=Neurospora intermedia TaxID=5142 RepID=A0ABR3DBK4_NEUIN
MVRTRESCNSIHASVTPYPFLREPVRVLQRAETELHHSTRKWQGDHSSFNSMFSSAPHCAMLLRAMIPCVDGVNICNWLKAVVMGKQNQSHNIDALEDQANEAGPGNVSSSVQSMCETQDSRINAGYLDVFRRHVFGRLEDVVFSASKALRGNVVVKLNTKVAFGLRHCITDFGA